MGRPFWGVVLMFNDVLTHFMDVAWLLAYMAGSVDCRINRREGYDAAVLYVTDKLWKKRCFLL
jgi:hypothetical protein